MRTLMLVSLRSLCIALLCCAIASFAGTPIIVPFTMAREDISQQDTAKNAKRTLEERVQSSLKTRTTKNPFVPAFFHSLSRYVAKVAQPTDLDTILWGAAKNAQLSDAMVRDLVDKWKSLPLTFKDAYYPSAFNKLPIDSGISLAMLAPEVTRAAKKIKTPFSSGSIPQAQWLKMLMPFINSIEPSGLDFVYLLTQTREFKVNGSSFSATPSENSIHIYSLPSGGSALGTPIKTFTATSSTSRQLIATCPSGLAGGQYLLRVVSKGKTSNWRAPSHRDRIRLGSPTAESDSGNRFEKSLRSNVSKRGMPSLLIIVPAK